MVIKAIKFRLLLLAAIVIWIFLGTPIFENNTANGFAVGAFLFVLEKSISYQIFDRMRQFILITGIGVTAMMVTCFTSFASNSDAQSVQFILLASCGIIGYGMAGVLANM